MKTQILLILLLLTGWTSVQSEVTVNWVADDAPEYKIGIKPSGPFAYKINDEWQGVSVELVKKLSDTLGFKYKFIEVDTLAALLSLAEFRSVDMSIGALSMTSDREEVLDFSHPYFTTTQGILSKENGNTLWFILTRIISAVFVLLSVLYVTGFIISRLERDQDINNIHKGAWWTLVTFTTTGYGKFVPQTVPGMLFAAVVMLASAFGLAGFTGYVSASLTVEKLTDHETTLADLTNKTVYVIGGSTSQDLLRLLQIKHKTVTTVEQGIKLVRNNEADAFVYDKAVLDYLVIKEDNAHLGVYSINRGQERYGIAFPSESELREPFNRAILDIIDSSEWKELNVQYFGN